MGISTPHCYSQIVVRKVLDPIDLGIIGGGSDPAAVEQVRHNDRRPFDVMEIARSPCYVTCCGETM